MATAKRKRTTKRPATPKQPKRPALSAAERYERRKERERRRQAKQSEAGRDIAAGMPKCSDAKIRGKCQRSFKFFCLEVFPEKFDKPFSPDHLKAIGKMENSILHGLRFALAMPRGSGKTTLIICAVIWAIVTGRRRYVALIGPTATHAKKMLRTIRKQFEENQRLLELYPEACYPVRRLEGIVNRARGQLYDGKRTGIEWTKQHIILAAIGSSKCSGAIIEVAGMTGSIRGMQMDGPGGETLRPDLVIIDDPQTKRSAKSDTMCDDRMETIQGDILGLAGPGKSIAGFLLCTVIRRGDVADQLLNSKDFPDWQGERFQLVYSWPEAEELWDEYALLLADELAAGAKKLKRCTAFYKKHRRKMDRGMQVAWSCRFDADRGELSAQQHAYNLLLRDEEAFWCEYQNQPHDPDEDDDLLSVVEIMQKVSGYRRGVVPPWADLLTAFIDVQGKCLYWVVVAWRSEDFSGAVIDYGAWPDQKLHHFKLQNVRQTLSKKYPRAGLEGRIKAGLIDLVDILASRSFQTPDGHAHRVQRIGIDAAWGNTSDTVREVCRTHTHATLLLPVFGKGLTPRQAPMESWKRDPGERRGFHWLIRPSKGGGRHLISDVNFWKTFVHLRFSTADGDRGSLSVPKPRPRLPHEHRMLAEHCRAENRRHVVGPERRGDVWEEKKGRPDNHLFDGLVHCAVMASVEGAQPPARSKSKGKARKQRGYCGALAA